MKTSHIKLLLTHTDTHAHTRTHTLTHSYKQVNKAMGLFRPVESLVHFYLAAANCFSLRNAYQCI